MGYKANHTWQTMGLLYDEHSGDDVPCFLLDVVLPRDFQTNGHASGNLTISSWLPSGKLT